MKNLLFALRSKMSNNKQSVQRLLQATPKNMEIELNSNFIFRLFEQSKKNPSYLLLKQLFEYLKTSSTLAQQFPLIKTDPQLQQNWMVIHVYLLKSRFLYQKLQSDIISQQDLEILNYNAQTYFFVPFAQQLHPHTPTNNFAVHFAEAFKKRFDIYEQQLQNFEESAGNSVTAYSYGSIFKKLVFNHMVEIEDKELVKFCKYYLAHKKYLQMLDWQGLMENKVKWGFEGEIKLIESL